MGEPVSILPAILGFATDLAPEAMAKGFMLDLVDLIPDRQEARLTNRGAWTWASQDLTGEVDAGIVTTTTDGDQLWLATRDGSLWNAPLNALAGELVLTKHATGTYVSRQNPVQLKNDAVHFPGNGLVPPQLWRPGGVVTPATGSMKNPLVGTTWQDMLVSAGDPSEPHVVRYSVPKKDLANADSYDALSNYPTNGRVTALAALKSVILVFHAGSVERIRGTEPARTPIGVDPRAIGDLHVEKLFDRVGCLEPKSIAYWNEYCLFADEHGVHMTDGSTIRNLVSEGMISNTWRPLYDNRASICATVFQNYYIVTLRAAGDEPKTLVCNLNTRRWFRFKNIDAFTLFTSSGSRGMERVWGGLGTRLASLGPCFFPVQDDVGVVDANNVWVQPHFITPYNRLGPEGRKRIRFFYLSYDLRKPNPPLDDRPDPVGADWRDRILPDPPVGAPRPPIPDPPAPVPRPPVPLPPYTESGDPNNPGFTFNDPNVLRLGYLINTPTYPISTLLTPAVVDAGWLPEAKGYARYKLPVGKFGYGISIFMDTTMPVGYLRIYDIAVEYSPAERSRV